jgi:hypothetical protein
MGIFFEKPTKGPDVVGGVWPIKDRGRCWNRAGATLSKGDVVQLAITPGAATEIATNDSNSYIPGASNDTVWNTVIDPRSSTTVGSSIERGGIWGVVLDTEIADNAYGWVQFFGIVNEAYCIKASGGDQASSGDPMTITTANNFDAIVNSNETVVAWYMDIQQGLTNRTLARVFLHNGLFSAGRGEAGATRYG